MTSQDTREEIARRLNSNPALGKPAFKNTTEDFLKPGQVLATTKAKQVVQDLPPDRKALLQKVQIIQEKLSRKLHVEVTPGLTPIWIRNAESAIYDAIQKEMFFPKPEQVLSARVQANESGKFVIGDVVLMVMQTELYEAYNAYNELKGIDAVEGGKRVFTDFASEHKIRSSRE